MTLSGGGNMGVEGKELQYWYTVFEYNFENTLCCTLTPAFGTHNFKISVLFFVFLKLDLKMWRVL